MICAVYRQRIVQLGLGCHIGTAECRLRKFPFRKVTHGPGHAADLHRFQRMGLEVFTQNQLGGAPADIDYQPPLVRARQEAGRALVDQARFFAARHHVDGHAQNLAAARQKFRAIDGLAQRLRAYGADVLLGKVAQALFEPFQTRPAALHGLE